MMIDVNFEVTGRNLRELEDAAAVELLKFVGNDGRSIDYSLDVSSRAGTYDEHPNVVLWHATVRATVGGPVDRTR